MRVHLHSDGDRPKVSFNPDELARQQWSAATHDGVRGWIDRQAAAYRQFWRTGDGAFVRGARSLWDRLQHLGADDEPLLAHLRSLNSVEVTHDPSLPPEDARTLWDRYLASRWRRHGLWFVVNVAISPLTVVLMPLPGPNLIGYWFAYRAFHHGLILSGLRKIARGDLPATFHPTDSPPPETNPRTDEPADEPQSPMVETGSR